MARIKGLEGLRPNNDRKVNKLQPPLASEGIIFIPGFKFGGKTLEELGKSDANSEIGIRELLRVLQESDEFVPTERQVEIQLVIASPLTMGIQSSDSTLGQIQAKARELGWEAVPADLPFYLLEKMGDYRLAGINKPLITNMQPIRVAEDSEETISVLYYNSYVFKIEKIQSGGVRIYNAYAGPDAHFKPDDLFVSAIRNS